VFALQVIRRLPISDHCTLPFFNGKLKLNFIFLKNTSQYRKLVHKIWMSLSSIINLKYFSNVVLIYLIKYKKNYVMYCIPTGGYLSQY
jgi:hypothetical protein